METMSPAAAKILGGKGKKLKAHEIHLRRTANKGYIAKHIMRDRDGNPPMDGQRGELEYALADHDAMLKHVDEHYNDTADASEDDTEA
jgi:hypothetical protein